MRSKLQDKLNLFAENVEAIRGDFVWQDASAKRLAALVYSSEGRMIDNDAIRDSHTMIKAEAGAFSSFRGNLAIYVSAALSLAEKPGQLLGDAMHVYDLLREKRFWASDFLAAAAFEIAANADREDYSRIAGRTKDFFDEMRAGHRFHIGKDDDRFAAMLARSDIAPHYGVNKMKRLFQCLRAEFSRWIGKGGLLTLAQMLVLAEGTEECVLNLLRLNRRLRQEKIRLDRSATLASLGVLGMIGAEHCALANDIIEARDFLRSQKGLGSLAVTTEELMLYAVALITYTYADDIKRNLIKAGVTTSITNLIIAQQVAVMSSMAAANAAVIASF
jgi:hypothetical protein